MHKVKFWLNALLGRAVAANAAQYRSLRRDPVVSGILLSQDKVKGLVCPKNAAAGSVAKLEST